MAKVIQIAVAASQSTSGTLGVTSKNEYLYVLMDNGELFLLGEGGTKTNPEWIRIEPPKAP